MAGTDGTLRQIALLRRAGWLGAVLAALLIAQLGAARPASGAGRLCSTLLENTWTGTKDSSWFSPQNWSAGHVPTATENACIDLATNTPVVIGTGATAEVKRLRAYRPVVLSAGTLKLDGPAVSLVQNTTFTLGAATLDGAGSLQVAGSSTFHWTGTPSFTSYVLGSGTLEIATGSALAIDDSNGAGFHTAARPVVIDAGATGSLTGQGLLQISSGVTFGVGGTFTLLSDAQISGGPQGGLHVLAGGTLVKSAGLFGTDIYAPINNDGTVQVNASRITFRGGDDTQVNTGTWSVASGTFIVLDTNFSLYELGGGTFAGTGTIGVASATLRLDSALVVPAGLLLDLFEATVDGAGTLTVDGTLRGQSSSVAVALENDGLVHGFDGALSLSGGSGAASDSGNWQADALAEIDFLGGTDAIAGGHLFGQGVVHVKGATLDVSGLTIDPAATLAIDGGTVGGTGALTVDGALRWSGDSTMTGAGATTIASGGALTIDDGAGPGNRNLRGGRTLDLAAGSTGTWNGSDDLQLGEGAVLNVAGTLVVTNDRTIGNLGGVAPLVHVLAGGALSKSAGGGTTMVQTALTDEGALGVGAGTLYLAGGLTNYNPATHTLGGGSYLLSGGGTLQFPGADVQTNAALVSLDGAGSHLSDGSLDGLRNLGVNAAGGTLTLAGGKVLSSAAAFANQGSFGVLVAGPAPGTAGELQLGGSATLGGTLALATAAGFVPPLGQTYTILVYPGHTGKFKTITGQAIPGSDEGYAVTVGSAVTLTVKKAADLSVLGSGPATAPAGSTIAYTETVHNGGPAGATGLKLTDTLPAGATLVSASSSKGTCAPPSGGKVVCTIGGLAFGAADVTVTIQVKAPSTPGVTLTNKASVKSKEVDVALKDNTATQKTKLT